MGKSVENLILLFALAGMNDARGQDLSDYLRSHSHLEVKRDLIACAAGGQAGFMGKDSQPVSVFFYPLPGAKEFKYFESDSLDIDPQDLSSFREVAAEHAPVFNGFLRRFVTSNRDRENWVRVSYLAPDGVHLSAAIRLKITQKPTQFVPDVIEIRESLLHPLFHWRDGLWKDNVIYFEVISDESGNPVSATYTRERKFRFNDASNVVINLKEGETVSALQAGKTYRFTLMGVSEDNWVNLIAEEEFIAQP